MRETFKSERHYALDDFCCHGDCRQGRDCPRDRKPADATEALWIVLPFFCLVAGAVGLFLAAMS